MFAISRFYFALLTVPCSTLLVGECSNLTLIFRLPDQLELLPRFRRMSFAIIGAYKLF